MSLDPWCHKGSDMPSSCATFTFNSHWGRAATGKKSLASMCPGSIRSRLTPCTLQTVACQGSLSGRGVLQARILEHIGQYWVSYPSRALYFLLPQPPTSLSNRCCQNPCNPSSCTTSTPGPHRGKPKSSRAASGANPGGRPICRGENKTTTETQGAVWLRKKTQNLPASCTICRLNPQDQLGRLCLWNI